MSAPRIYLDNNATTQPFREVVDVMARQFRENYANPGSGHADGQAARKVLETAREQIADILGAGPQEVVFTSGGTEATNLAVFGLTGQGAETASSENAPGTIVLTPAEHPATMESCRHLERHGWNLHRLELDSAGQIQADQLKSLPWDDVRLVTVILAHNETGVIQDLAPLSERCREHRVPLHVDAVQAVGKIPVNFHELGAATLSLGAHKFHGPRGIGALLLREDVTLQPWLFGGHQENGRRPGTEPVALAAGMATALKVWHDNREEGSRKLRELRDHLQRGLQQACSPTVVHAAKAPRLPNTLNIAFPGVDGEALLVNLDLAGISCSLGSTCASGSAEPAPILQAMGCPPEVAVASVRFSLCSDNTREEIDEAIRRISEVVVRMRASSAKPV